VLVDSHGVVLFIFGRTGQFLEPSAGDATMNVLSMAREGLRRELTIALHKAVAQKQPVRYAGLNVKANGDYIRANLSVRPLDTDASTDAYLVVLEEVTPHAHAEEQASEGPLDHGGRISELERELRCRSRVARDT
jgi:two-component system, chemotaxis family, CheB/CheR fusion protein